MAIDKAELATELEKNPEIATAAIEALNKKGYSVYDKAKHDEFFSGIRKDTIEKEVKVEASKIYSQLDTDIESLYGVKRNQDEKTYDYNKRAANAKLTELDGKIKEYEKTIKEKGDPQGIWQKRIDDAENKAKTAIEERDSKINNLSKENEKATKGIILHQVYGELSKSFMKQLPPMFSKLSKMTLDEILLNAVLKDGNLYVGDGTGGVKRDSAFKEITVEDFLKTEFKDVIDVKRTQTGTGSSGKGRTVEDFDIDTINKDNFVMPDEVRNQDDLMGAMIKQGLKRGTNQFNDIWNKFALGFEYKVEGPKRVRVPIGKALPMQ